jgi:hypothetical protein
MSADFNLYRDLLGLLTKDSRITVWHMAAMFGIIQLSNSGDIKEPIYISRKRVMELAHINNFVTYHKCIKELQEFGYILYCPSYHPGIGSKVIFRRLPELD